MNREHPSRAFGLLFSAVLFWACGDDAGNPGLEIAKFALNECKSAGGSGSGNTLLTGRETVDYVGLDCVAWDFDSSTAKIDLINRHAGCGFGGGGLEAGESSLWTPAVKQVSDTKLQVAVEWKFDVGSACGDCLHDFSVAFRNTAHKAPRVLEVATRDCTDGCDWVRDSLKLPVGEEPTGIRCRYVEVDTPRSNIAPGKLNGSPRAGQCDESLVPMRVAEDSEKCLPRCEESADCKLSDLHSCVDGACQLTEPW